ncbi:MAG: DUF6452 family protein [Bacteroidota bacterium]
MKKRFILVLVLMVFIQFSACEKDDICVDGDTPNLVIGFFDAIDTADAKTVTLLRIKETSLDTTLGTGDFDRTSTRDSIGVPLRTNEDNITFAMITDSADSDTDNEETGNIDTLRITYNPREEFISRACGFVVQYDNIAIELTTDDDNWIQDINVVQTDIENENNIHVKIFH